MTSVIQLDPRTIWLRGGNGQVYFPQDGNFHFVDSIASLDVQGTPVAEPSTSSSLFLSGPDRPSMEQATPVCCTSKNTFSLKIVRANMKEGTSKPEFMPLEVGYVEINSKTANINFIRDTIQDRWGKNYQVVSNEGLPILDSPATRGRCKKFVRQYIHGVCLCVWCIVWCVCVFVQWQIQGGFH